MNLVETEKNLKTFESLESEVRSYIRSFPTTFQKAVGYKMFDCNSNEYIDFFSGAGTLNYGHNNPKLKEKLIEYIASDNIVHSLDMATVAKEKFIKKFNDVILTPRNFNYKFMFPGPTGTNAVESAIKIARKVTKRKNIISFTNAFHGMTLGSLALSGNAYKRKGAGVPLHYSVLMPYDNYFGKHINTIEILDKYLEDSGSGVDLPAAIIFETVQGEGGINSASFKWMKELEYICKKWNILLIVDDIQVGCGRTGTFFSFEDAQIYPDIVCLSKSLSGHGLPMSLTLLKPEFDVWGSGEHNGTFRGNNYAFVTATEALSYWEKGNNFSESIKIKSDILQKKLLDLASNYSVIHPEIRGRGMIKGITFEDGEYASKVCSNAFKMGLLLETSGAKNDVIKILPPLTIDEDGINQGIELLSESIKRSSEL
ncbi:diaminobutyrate--2-oxoglutarate transaminase [Bacillus sp. SM2101]|uniref:diaminobutyrate--2-oxoglutarate transaminase n=1 Tax=Bacillus sp. SM2101 TaxID=2805366 RepID=UPI002032E421|nr:diaminobutyrate--2-oxoglutarate transaminase [Bacillus sp. SM2101]